MNTMVSGTDEAISVKAWGPVDNEGANRGCTSVPAPGSEWPFSLLLDEVWLRSRRALVHELESHALWPVEALQRAFMAEQRALGEDLRQEILPAVLGPTDFARLHSEALYGGTADVVAKRIPFVLAFGYELGFGLHGLRGAEPHLRADVGQLSATFNLGISLFDSVCDRCPAAIDPLLKVLDQPMLVRLQDTTCACDELRDVAEDQEMGELRVLLKIVAAFFQRYQQVIRSANGPPVPEELRSLISAAYDAELGSIAYTRNTHAEETGLSTVARLKSILPFQVIHEISRLSSRTSDETPDLRTLVNHIAEAIWYTDDLVDVVADLQQMRPNHLVQESVRAASELTNGPTEYDLLNALLRESILEATSIRIREHARAALGILDSEYSPHAEAARLTQVVRHYIRDWLEFS